MTLNSQQACFSYYIIVSTEDHIQLVKGGIGTYWGLLLKSFEKHLPKQSLSYGFIHGDCSPDNLIKLQHDISFLDFDSIKTDFQLFDLTDLLLKYSNKPKQNEELKIIQEYIKITGFYKSSELMCLYNLLNVISCYRGLLMALSTEYYCFEKQKFSPEVMDTFFLKKVLLLANNTKCRLKGLRKCQEKLQGHTVEFTATLKTTTK